MSWGMIRTVPGATGGSECTIAPSFREGKVTVHSGVNSWVILFSKWMSDLETWHQHLLNSFVSCWWL